MTPRSLTQIVKAPWQQRRVVNVLAFRRTLDGELRVFDGHAAEITVGRSDTKQRSPTFFQLAEEDVSRRHGELSRTRHGWTYRDLNSSNGTWYNGERVTAHDVGPLRVGDTFCFGSVDNEWCVVESDSSVLPRERSTQSTRKASREDLLQSCSLECGAAHADARMSIILCEGTTAIEYALPDKAQRARQLLQLLAVARDAAQRGAHPDAGWMSRQELVQAMGWEEDSRGFNSCLAQIERLLSKHEPLREIVGDVIEDEKRGTKTFYRLALRVLLRR